MNSNDNTNTNETRADIIREMRDCAITKIGGRTITKRNFVPQETVEDWADRIEAAAKRDAAIHAMTCEANERLREHLEIALEGKPGNAAAMREALEACLREMCERCRSNMAENMQTPSPCPGCDIVVKARAALAAPAPEPTAAPVGGSGAEPQSLAPTETVGNVAAMREALETILRDCKGGKGYDHTGMKDTFFDSIEEQARAALFAPARNCDRFRSIEEAWAAWDGIDASEKTRIGGIYERIGGFDQWLFAKAEGVSE